MYAIEIISRARGRQLQLRVSSALSARHPLTLPYDRPHDEIDPWHHVMCLNRMYSTLSGRPMGAAPGDILDMLHHYLVEPLSGSRTREEKEKEKETNCAL
jgi:hypothetical protein